MTIALPDRAATRAAALTSAPAAVEVDGVSKTFRLPHRRYSTLKERALHPWAATRYEDLRAVQDLSVSIRRGEFFGVVGRNGSGKSTLLKCLAGIYRVDAGEIRIAGRLSPFIELGVGFNPELTARDNVLINAVMLGLSRREARARFDEIIAFAELEDFLDLRLKNYSSGMSVRLAFSVAIQADAEILLVDEVLAVGDAAFQQKCYDQFHRLKDAGRTIVFVTHDMSAVEVFCDRAMLLERGRTVDIGDPKDVARQYNELNFGSLAYAADETGKRAGDHEVAEIVAAWFEGPDRRRISSIEQGQALTMAIELRFHEDVEEPAIAFHLRNEARHVIFATSTMIRGVPIGTARAGERLTVRTSLDTWFAPGRYLLTPTVADRTGLAALDLREDMCALHVRGNVSSGGAVDPPHDYDVERG